MRFLRDIKGASVVYVQTHAVSISTRSKLSHLLTVAKQTKTVCAILTGAGFNAFEYHAGMPSDARTMTQENFMKSKDIIVRHPQF